MCIRDRVGRPVLAIGPIDHLGDELTRKTRLGRSQRTAPQPGELRSASRGRAAHGRCGTSGLRGGGLSGVHGVQERGVPRLEDLALEFRAWRQLVGLHGEVVVEDPEVLDGLPAVQLAVELLDAIAHVGANRRVRGQPGEVADVQSPGAPPLGEGVAVQGDQCAGIVAPLGVHDDLAGQRAERLELGLDRLWGDVLASGGLDEILLAVRDPQSPLRIELADVAGGEPAVGAEHASRLLGQVVVPPHDVGAAEQDLPVVGDAELGSDERGSDDGEILLRGPHVMRGYHNLPEETARVLSPDGWFSTGDIGELDTQGRLRVTDRKKDLIKTSGGKYIAPQPIAAQLKALCPLASQVIVHAERRNFASALVALDGDALTQWGRARGLDVSDFARLAADPAVRAYVGNCIQELNSQLNRWETIKDFRILDHDLTVEADELTPSMKLKRKVLESRYSSLLDSMYTG